MQSASPPGATAALSGGNPASATVTVGAGLQAGDSVQITLGLRDGTSRTLTLKAAADDKAAGTFAIGASPADTAKNLQAALATALDASARTDLAASSATRAAGDFFAGSSSPGLSPRRVATDTAGNATAYVADPSGRTLIWYKGDDTSADPRGTATVPVSRDQSVAIGVQANEAPFRKTLSGLAVLATTSFDDTDADGRRFDAYSGRLQTLFKPGDGQTLGRGHRLGAEPRLGPDRHPEEPEHRHQGGAAEDGRRRRIGHDRGGGGQAPHPADAVAGELPGDLDALEADADELPVIPRPEMPDASSRSRACPGSTGR